MKPIIELIRLEENERFGTFGVLKVNKEVFCVTLEPADRENARNVSSIPAQQYTCRRTFSPKYGDTFQVMNVPERDHVLLHPGNLVEHTEGCIIVAEFFGKLKGGRAVLNSGKTFKRLLSLLEGHNEFHLTIREVF